MLRALESSINDLTEVLWKFCDARIKHRELKNSAGKLSGFMGEVQSYIREGKEAYIGVRRADLILPDGTCFEEKSLYLLISVLYHLRLNVHSDLLDKCFNGLAYNFDLWSKHPELLQAAAPGDVLKAITNGIVSLRTYRMLSPSKGSTPSLKSLAESSYSVLSHYGQRIDSKEKEKMIDFMNLLKGVAGEEGRRKLEVLTQEIEYGLLVSNPSSENRLVLLLRSLHESMSEKAFELVRSTLTQENLKVLPPLPAVELVRLATIVDKFSTNEKLAPNCKEMVHLLIPHFLKRLKAREFSQRQLYLLLKVFEVYEVQSNTVYTWIQYNLTPLIDLDLPVSDARYILTKFTRAKKGGMKFLALLNALQNNMTQEARRLLVECREKEKKYLRALELGLISRKD
eukprot:TRINITY_DN4777_c0_g1_i6.p1 TRINITY_DN4777_c0_g1~~TRINITY_DN4777_c0_g1_i6.p1  ORF type:complete len:399 (+),score=79.31 TRINITY_DN4777_c0_g1_i6:923-2119(+)